MKKTMYKEIEHDKDTSTCPYCDSTEYSRHDQDWFEDMVSLNCHCNSCDKEFKESFGLVEQEYEVDEK